MRKEEKQKFFLQVGVIVTGILVFLVIWRFDTVIGLVKAGLHILQPILIGVVLAYLLYPMVRWFRSVFEKYLPRIIRKENTVESVSNLLSIVIVFCMVSVCVYWLGRMVLPELVSNIIVAVNQVPRQLRTLVAYATEKLQANQASYERLYKYITQLQDVLQNWLQNNFLRQVNTLLTSVSTGIFGAISLFSNLIIGIIVALYALSSARTFKRQLKKLIYAVLPEQKVPMTIQVLRQSNAIFSGFISGKVIDGIIIGILCFVFMQILEMPYTALISVIVGVTNIIPFFGPYIGGVIGTILLLLVSPKDGLIFILFILVLQQVDGNIIGPAILGDSTGLTPFWVIFAILVGGGIFGVAGMILGVPTLGVIYYVVSLTINRKLEKKGIPMYIFGKPKEEKERRTVRLRLSALGRKLTTPKKKQDQDKQ
ncbi:MAG: AI-2E family transporter [Lachnospiraceae bacterium]|nr:AI-2E family transporter [Lachnospiraceae bacterium]